MQAKNQIQPLILFGERLGWAGQHIQLERGEDNQQKTYITGIRLHSSITLFKHFGVL